MVSTVKSQPNHYETLGLTPSASEDDIARAFAREISPLRPRAIGGVALLSVAYETLRDPIKRLAYDGSLGFKPEPVPNPWPPAGPGGWRFVASAHVGPVGQAAMDPVPGPARHANSQPRPEAPAEPRTAPFTAASPRKPVTADEHGDRATTPRPQPDRSRRPETQAKPRFTSQTGGDRALRTALQERLLYVEDSAIDWKRPALVGGGLFLGVALFGAWLGWESSNDIQAEQPEQAVTFAVPVPLPLSTDSPPAEAPSVTEARPVPRTLAAPAAKPRIARTPPPPQPAPSEDQQAQAVQSEQSQPEQIATEPASADSLQVAAIPARLPLPNSVIARTIGRIGYPCGQVGSTTAVEGGATGVFKVTCTSGHSYRAAPVGGRYRFRRWGGN